jgi:sentrin-specific protease 1
MIVDAANKRKEMGSEGARDVHWFSTFFFSKLESVGYEKGKLARWTKKVRLRLAGFDR